MARRKEGKRRPQPQDAHKEPRSLTHGAQTGGSGVRDPRGPLFAAEASQTMQVEQLPCRVSSGSGGLGVYASRSISAGERVAFERPLALTISHNARAHFCAVCLADSRRSSPPLKCWTLQCETCHTQYYCSDSCAAAIAARHGGTECTALLAASSDPAVDDDTVDTVAQAIRILADRANGISTDVGPAGCFGYAAYAERLVAITPSTSSARECLRTTVDVTLRALPEEARVPPAELHELLERHSCNLYGVTGRAGEDVASASFVGLFHLFNHACCPNVVFDSGSGWRQSSAVGDGSPSTFSLIALTDIAQGSELCISYTSSAEGPTLRSDHLSEHYGFRCTCHRCTCDDVNVELDYSEMLERLRCAEEECGSGLSVPCGDEGPLGFLRCVHCGTS
eukprot:CAMPEP_0174717748 /NCGR_PEP_ID=MMETSP1094-20130205/27099_1 /TAXON_ID=156173 /ORGANISM="Chrysochromulina brevifilum, Strain UTEX LB 985" /LENGTH=394 /DNA_ID=CAMNT_0015917735 /DNA_START=202 /DNA_END=1383 /DNA_ORIENTATION=+